MSTDRKKPIDDLWGIGSSLQGAAHVFFMTSRRTGRTEHLIASLNDGDRVVFFDPQEAERIQRRAKERGVTIDTVVMKTKDPHRVFEHNTPQGRTIFDHSWVEQYYLAALEDAQARLSSATVESSGYGPKHRETRNRFAEMRGDPFRQFNL